MKYFLIIALLLATPAFAEEPCENKEHLVIGDKTVVVEDPLSLLRAARNNGAKKTLIADHYHGCHPVLKMVAEDNGMTCREFLEYTGILAEFEKAMIELENHIEPYQYQFVYDAMLQRVVNDIVDQILSPRTQI